MRRIALCLMMSLAVALPAAAAEQPAGSPDGISRLSELTAQYTKLYLAKSYKEATAAATEALAVAEKTLGPEHEKVAQVLNDLGHLYKMQQDLARAQSLHERALQIRRKVYHDDGPAVEQSLHQLAGIYAAQGRYPQAQEAYEQSLALLERNFSPNDPILLSVLRPYEAVLEASGQTEMAQSVKARIFVLQANNPKP